MGRSQATIFFIIGILIIVIASFFLFKPNLEIKVADSAEKSLFNAQIDSCIKQTIIEGEKLYGLHKQKTPSLISAYVTKQLPLCIDFNGYEEKGFSVEQKQPNVNIKITNDALIADVYYPITLKKDNLKFSFDKSIYTYPRIVMEKLKQNSATYVVSADGKIRLEIPAGTEVTLNGKPVNAVGIKQLDRNFNGMSNSVLMGMTAYNGVPHGAVFSKPIKIIYYYDDWEVPPFIKEEDIKIGYFPDDLNIWIGLPTKVDPVNNILMVETTHFSIYGSVVRCGTDQNDVLNQIITPVLIREGCRSCKDWKFVQDYNPEYPIYPGQLYKPSSELKVKEGTKNLLDYPNSGGSCNDELYISTVQPKSSQFNPCHFLEECKEIDENEDKCGTQKCICDDENKRYEFLDFDDFSLPFVAQLVNFDPSKITLDSGSSVNINGKSFTINSLKNFLSLVNSLSPGKKFIKSSNENLNGKCADNKGDIIKIENLQYETQSLYFCGLESCAYDKAEDIKARQVYEIHFKGLGDSCIAQADQTEDTTDNLIDAGEGLDFYLEDIEDSNADSEPETKSGEAITVIYNSNSEKTSNLKNHELKIDIMPICYEEDDCKILNAHFKKCEGESCGNNDITLEFVVESINKKPDNGNPDACLMGAAQILFQGSGVKGNYNILCNADSKDKYNFIDGKCKKCIEKIISGKKTYLWIDSGADCLFFPCNPDNQEGNKCCSSSLINKKINYNDNCYLCMPYNANYGIWQESDNCESCGEIKSEQQNDQ